MHTFAQVTQMLSLYQGVLAPPEHLRGGAYTNGEAITFATIQHGLTFKHLARSDFPPNSFVYTMCGILGSCLTIISLSGISTILWGQGVQSARIPAVCKVAVYFLGLSGGLPDRL